VVANFSAAMQTCSGSRAAARPVEARTALLAARRDWSVKPAI
jgi:hypothetical protein